MPRRSQLWPADVPARALSANTVARAALAAAAFVAVLLPAAVVIGAFVPTAPILGRFGGLVDTNLPWLLAEAIAATALSLLVVWLGGRRFAMLLSAFTGVVSIGLLAITGVLMVFASQHGASFSLIREAASPGRDPVADQRVVFATVDGTPLHADIWHSNAAASAAGSPAVLFIHGGAFTSGGLGGRAPFFRALAGEGYTVIDVEYRLAPPPRWHDAPGDVLCAMSWLRASANELGVDPAKVVVMGESAGGSLALVAGYAADSTGLGSLTPSCAGSPVAPVGVIAISPAADLAGIWADDSIPTPDGRYPESYIGGTPAQYPDRYDQASPFRLVRAGLPPTLFITGANDHFVYVTRVTEIADKLSAAGDDVTTVVIPFLDHGLDGPPNGAGVQIEEGVVPAFLARVTR